MDVHSDRDRDRDICRTQRAYEYIYSASGGVSTSQF